MPRKRKRIALPTKFKPGFLNGLDGRTELAQALKLRFDDISYDLGGIEELSAIKASLLERFIWLEATLSKIEADLANTGDAKTAADVMTRWIQGCNLLLGIARTLGMERQVKSVDLKTYVKGKIKVKRNGSK